MGANETIEDFLAQNRVAVAGVSRSKNEAANAVYRKLRGAGYRVFAVNPNAQEVEGDPCFPDLRSVPGGIAVIPGGCPLMFCEPIDIAHRCIGWVLGVTGRLP